MRLLLAGAALLPTCQLMAQPVPAPTPAPTQPATEKPTTDPAVTPPPSQKVVGAKKVYVPADFARFAPRTGYDMLVQVPGFTIISPSQGELDRGLGQATENVLINGERIANKSGGAVDELRRTAASNIDRIEIVDAASLGIAGLSGQIANVILKAGKKGSGQFEWRPDFRAHFAKPNLFRGNVSWSDSKGPVDYTISVKDDAGRGAIGGPIWISDRNHVLTETRYQRVHNESDLVTFQTKLHYKGAHESIGNLTLGYTPYWAPQWLVEDRFPVNGPQSHRRDVVKLDGFYYDINADYDFKLGPGRLKLIGLRHLDHEPLIETQVDSFFDGSPSTGIMFTRDSHIGETIGRAEYGWKTGKNDWQVTFERAYNSLDQKGRLFQLDPDENFVEVPFPEGTGKVTEVRYEGLGTFSRPLASNLDLQVAAGAEISQLDRVDDSEPARKFFRPKGSVTLGWRPAKNWDVSLKLRRRVGQISFYDFLAQPQLAQDRENAGNPDLIPPQSWEAETEFSHDLGRWGKTRLNLHYYRVEDIVDVIPIGTDQEGIGNLPRANRYGFESVSTFQLDPLGLKGAKIDLTIGREWTSVRDPLTHEKRAITNIQDKWGNLQIRHDIPNTPFAWSWYVQYRHYTPNFFLTEVFSSQDLPWITGFYVEHKNFLGLTVRFTVDNILNGRHLVDRTVYAGFRDRNPVSFFEKRNQLVGPIFNLSIKGTF